jgi:uncharacterized protein with PQ loop repeat
MTPRTWMILILGITAFSLVFLPMKMIGWVGAIMFAICAIPQAWTCFKNKNGDGLSWPFILLWIGGELLTYVYIWPKQDWPLIFNYTVNILCLVVILYYMIFPKRDIPRE